MHKLEVGFRIDHIGTYMASRTFGRFDGTSPSGGRCCTLIGPRERRHAGRVGWGGRFSCPSRLVCYRNP